MDLRNAPEQNRYEAWTDGTLAGFAEYRLSDGRIVFTHTEVFPQFEGQGVGSALARFALDEVHTLGELKVVPRCPFIKGWIEHHPEYQSLVTGDATWDQSQ